MSQSSKNEQSMEVIEGNKTDADLVSATGHQLEDTEDSFPTYPSYNYPDMAPPYPSRYDVISFGMSVGVGIGGIIGMLIAIWIQSAIGETIVIFAGMAIGTMIGGGFGLAHYLLNKPTGDLDYVTFDEEQGFTLSK